jgi:hypothetical protein
VAEHADADKPGIQPPFLDHLGPAPAGVCSRWMDGSPCGAAGVFHVIWDYEMRNGCLCDGHAAEARREWAYAGLHPYTAACASPGTAFWLPDEDRCVFPDSEDAGRERPGMVRA